MGRVVLSVVLFTAGISYSEEKVFLHTIKDREVIKCLSDYIKNNRTHVTMVVDENGERKLQIPKSYVEQCRKQLGR
ncbi:hypothetical protein [Persephonella sp.]